MKDFPELKSILELSQFSHPLVDVSVLDKIEFRGRSFPIHAFKIGSKKKNIPVMGVFGGVHGLERVGTQVVISYLKSFMELLKWDKDLSHFFNDFKIVLIPLVNPAGMFHHMRSNPNGIDLNRNAPVEAEQSRFLLSGHRIGSFLPWYRGKENSEMEKESKALCHFVETEIFPSPFCITLDIHSGFGLKDRIWYPYAKSKSAFPDKEKVHSLKSLLDETFPYHIYKVEPQSNHYTAHGDLWDYLYDLRKEKYPSLGPFLPLTLELGSWMWVKKNPIQAFSALGHFNPLKKHRHSRIMRRHLILIDFLRKATKNYQNWGSSKCNGC